MNMNLAAVLFIAYCLAGIFNALTGFLNSRKGSY